MIQNIQFLAHISPLKPLSHIKRILTLIKQNLSIQAKLDLLNKIYRESKGVRIGYCLLRLNLIIKRLKLGIKRISKNMQKIGQNNYKWGYIFGYIFRYILKIIFKINKKRLDTCLYWVISWNNKRRTRNEC
jgi:hypothetical protein